MPKRKAYVIDAPAKQRDPNLTDFFFYPRSHVAAHEKREGRIIHDFLVSRSGAALLMGAVLAAPSRPPVVAVEPFLAQLAGAGAFTDEMKKYTGRVVRQVIEHLGGRFVRRGVRITVPSKYGSGSIYTFSGGLRIEDVAAAVTGLENRTGTRDHGQA